MAQRIHTVSSVESSWTDFSTDTEPVRLTCLQGRRTAPCTPLKPRYTPAHQHSSTEGAIIIVISSSVVSMYNYLIKKKKNTWSQVLEQWVAASDRQLGPASRVRLKSLKGQHVRPDPTHSVPEEQSCCLSFFLEESFSIFILICNYRLLNGRRRPICTHVIFH